MDDPRTLAEILGSEVHRANRNGAWAFPGGDILMFVPDAVTLGQLESAREWLAALIVVKDGVDQGGT
jgi:hypothetical protein